jgi:DNA topoisomerase III
MLWLDCDREGENICFEVMSVCCGEHRGESNNNNEKSSGGGGGGLIPLKNVFRAKFSALDEGSLKKAYEQCWGKPNKDESDGVDARQELDLKIGVAFTRFQTKFFANRYFIFIFSTGITQVFY